MLFLKKSSSILLLFILLALLTLNGCSSSENDKVKRYNSALEYIEKGNKDAAILELRSAIQLDPKYSDARYKLGLLYLEKKEPKLAFGELLRAADLNPENIDANLKVAQMYFLARQPDSAKKYINTVLTKKPDNKEGIILQTNLFMAEKQYERALENLSKLGEEVDKSALLQNLKGQIFVLQNDFNAAEKCFVRATELDKASLIGYKNLLQLYQNSGRQDDAKKLLDQMLKNFPENPEPHLLLAGYYNGTNQPEKITQELKTVVNLAPDNARFNQLLADHYFKVGDFKNAIITLEEAQKKLPYNLDIQAQLATIYIETKDFDKAREINEKIKAKQADFGGAKLIDARFLQLEGKLRDSITILNNLNNDFPNWPEPYYFLGLTYFNLGDLELAAQSVGTAISKAKGVAKYHALMAQLFLMQKNFENARNEAIISLRLNPKNLRSAIILSQALVGAKDYDKAVAILSDINKQIPGNPEIIGNLVMASFSTHDIEKGKGLLEELLAIDPGNTQAVLLLIGLNYKNNFEGAINFIKDQIKKAPEDGRLYLILGRSYEQVNNSDEALAAYEKVKEINPKNPEAYLLSARLLKKMGRVDQALATYEDILAKQPNSLPAHMGLATLYEVEGKRDKATDQYETILKIDEKYAPAANNLSWIIATSENGDMGRALMLAMVAKQALPNDPHVADTLGFVHFKRQAYTLAVRLFKIHRKNQPLPTIWLRRSLQTTKKRELKKYSVIFLKKEQISLIKKKLKSCWTRYQNRKNRVWRLIILVTAIIIPFKNGTFEVIDGMII